MSVGFFLDEKHKPTSKEILAAIGSKQPLWGELMQFIKGNYRVKEEFVFGGKKYEWAFRFRKRGKTLLTAYPSKESFVVQIVIGPTVSEEAFSLNLGKNVRKILENAHPYPDGRWLFIKTGSMRDIQDIKQLLLVKAHPVKK